MIFAAESGEHHVGGIEGMDEVWRESISLLGLVNGVLHARTQLHIRSGHCCPDFLLAL